MSRAEAEKRSRVRTSYGRAGERICAGASIREVVAEGVTKALSDPRCPRPCERIEKTEATVFGRSERGIVGLDERVRSVETFVANSRQPMWVAVTALATGIVSLIVAVLSLAATRYEEPCPTP